MNRIKGKLILVTGASSGIGEACARRFAAEGADLILWARRADRLERLAAELSATHRVSLSLAVVDVRDRTAVNRAAEALVRAGRLPDVLINNAGLASGLAKIHEGDPEDWDRMIDTNLKGWLNVTRAILPHMVARRRADDVADTIAYVVNLPEHVNILDLVIVPTAQRNVYVVDRDPGR